jgi:hypothetical protein
MKIPIIPPYTPATGITQSPPVTRHRRPPKGRFAETEAHVEAWYLEPALAIVREMWADNSAADIAKEIYCRIGYYGANVKLVYALKARLDTAARSGGE